MTDTHPETRGEAWWQRYFLDMAQQVASASKDPSTQVGAVIVDERRRVLGHGYNGLPRGVRDTWERLNDRQTKYRMIVHAEPNALLNAGRAVEGATLYVWPLPCCCECAKLVIQAGIRRVVAPAADVSRWQESFDIAAEMFSEAGVEMMEVE